MVRVNADDLKLDAAEYVVHNGERFTGEAVETTDDGHVISLNTYVNGHEEGPQREWYYDGQLRSEYFVVNGRIVGEARQWHENGRLAQVQHWDDHGEMRGHEEWDENGHPDPA
jgi:antitoxin component YwqK of YwqJK toxin-antitoxin module